MVAIYSNIKKACSRLVAAIKKRNLLERYGEIFAMEEWSADQSLDQVTYAKLSASGGGHHMDPSSAADAKGDHEASHQSVIEASGSSNGTKNVLFPIKPFSKITGEGVFEDMATNYLKEEHEKGLSSPLSETSAGDKLKTFPVDDSGDEHGKTPIGKKEMKKGEKGKGKDKGKGKEKQEREEILGMVQVKGKGKAKATKHANELEDEESDIIVTKGPSYIDKLGYRLGIRGKNGAFKNLGSSHLKPLREHVLKETPIEEWTEDDHEFARASLSKDLAIARVTDPKIVAPIAMRGEITDPTPEDEHFVGINRKVDRLIKKWGEDLGAAVDSGTTQQTHEVGEPLVESSIEAASRQSATLSCMINSECDSNYAEETDNEETVALTTPVGFTSLDKATQKRILELVLPTGMELFPFANATDSEGRTSEPEYAIKMKTATNIMEALCKRRDPKVLLSGELVRNILYRTNLFVFTRTSYCINFVGTVGVENLTRMSFQQNFRFARRIFPAETRTREFVWFQRWMPQISNLMRGEELVQSIVEWYQQALQPMHPVVRAAHAMFELWTLEHQIAACVEASKAESGENNPRVALRDFGRGFEEVQGDLDALLEKAGLDTPSIAN